jgi:glycerol-3-phosphate dehydrogenase (NAD(P)+)
MAAVVPVTAVLGAGSWGTALALQLARNGQQVVLWARNPQHAQTINDSRRNERFLPGIDFPDGIRATASLAEAVQDAGHVLLAVPSHAFGETLEVLAGLERPGSGVSWACKGFEPGSGRLLHKVAADLLPAGTPLAVVTGPSFAREVALELPTAVTVAGEDENYTERLAVLLHGGNFRAYTSTDIIGAELGGAVKNVLAVATGISDGMGLGDNARAALVTRGLAEMMRLGKVMGARPETMTGLAGMGDLVLTCTGDQSRNRRLGLGLGQGRSVTETVAEIGQVVEGVGTAAEVWRLANQLQVSMPISREVFRIIHEDHDPRECLGRLLAREQKAEHAAPLSD